MSRFVRPEVVTLTLANGDTLLVKKRLNAGETRQLYDRMLDEKTQEVQRMRSGVSTVLAYLLDWSLKDDSGQHVTMLDQPDAVKQAALDQLDPDDFREILGAIEKHEHAITAAREAEKKSQAGENKLSAISPSPSDVAGP
jgi:hypothetical protein